MNGSRPRQVRHSAIAVQLPAELRWQVNDSRVNRPPDSGAETAFPVTHGGPKQVSLRAPAPASQVEEMASSSLCFREGMCG
jgi:hypothetical protein